MRENSERKAVLLHVFLVLALACLAQADPITIQIGGYITSASGSGLPGSIYSGVTFSGLYTYDSATADSDADPQRGIYEHDSPYGINLDLGGYEFETTPGHTGQFEMRVADDLSGNGVKDYYTVFSHENVSDPYAGFAISSIRWDLMDSTHMALSSDDLPFTAPVLTAWDWNVLTISGSGEYGLSIYGTVTQVALVPEPFTGILLAAGLFFLRRRSRTLIG